MMFMHLKGDKPLREMFKAFVIAALPFFHLSEWSFRFSR